MSVAYGTINFSHQGDRDGTEWQQRLYRAPYIYWADIRKRVQSKNLLRESRT